MSYHHSVPCVMTSSDQFYVRLCTCGVVHLSFGCTVINVSPDAAVAISETLREVTENLRIELRKRVVSSLLQDAKTHPPDQADQNSALENRDSENKMSNVIAGRFPVPQPKI